MYMFVIDQKTTAVTFLSFTYQAVNYFLCVFNIASMIVQ